MPSSGRDAHSLLRYGRALVRHGRILLPLGAAIGAGVGYLWKDLLFGLLVGIAFGAAWALLLALHTKERRSQPAPTADPSAAETDDASDSAAPLSES
jgi:hypothetical protein